MTAESRTALSPPSKPRPRLDAADKTVAAGLGMVFAGVGLGWSWPGALVVVGSVVAGVPLVLVLARALRAPRVKGDQDGTSQ